MKTNPQVPSPKLEVLVVQASADCQKNPKVAGRRVGGSTDGGYLQKGIGGRCIRSTDCRYHG